MVTDAAFADEAVETEKTIAIADLALLRDDMYRYPMRLLTQGAFAGHPYGVPASGVEDSIERVDPAANPRVAPSARARRPGGDRDRR